MFINGRYYIILYLTREIVVLNVTDGGKIQLSIWCLSAARHTVANRENRSRPLLFYFYNNNNI